MLARQHGERRAEHQQVQVVGEEQRVQRLDDVGLRAVGAHGEAILLATQPVGVTVHATHAISEPAARAPCAAENRVRFLASRAPPRGPVAALLRPVAVSFGCPRGRAGQRTRLVRGKWKVRRNVFWSRRLSKRKPWRAAAFSEERLRRLHHAELLGRATQAVGVQRAR